MIRALQKLIHRIGHRGAFLIFIGFLFVVYGSGITTDPAIGIPAVYIFSNDVWGWIFIPIGAVVISGSLCVKNDRWFYMLAALMSAIWSSAWISMWFVHNHVPGAWALAAIWAADAAITLVVSSWRENYRDTTSPVNHANRTIAQNTGPLPRIQRRKD